MQSHLNLQCWSLAENRERAKERHSRENPEKQAIQHHGHEAPILIFLQNRKKMQKKFIAFAAASFVASASRWVFIGVHSISQN
jgi:hypothetical protein